MSKLKCLHRYKKFDIGAFGKPPYFVYKCIKPGCSHYIPIALAEGRLCECNRCGELMVIGKQVMSQSSGSPMTLPHCADCTKKRKVVNVDTITEFLDRVKPTI